MKRYIAIFALLAAAPVAMGQQNLPPRIGYVFPAGGQQGTTVDVAVGGQYLDNVSTVYVSGTGVKATISEHNKPMTQKEFNDLREKLAELQKKPRDAQTVKELAEIKQKMIEYLRKPSSPAIADTATLQVTIAPDAPTGAYELRLATPMGLSNPMVFNVGQLPEFTRKSSKGLEDLPELRALRTGLPPAGLATGLPVNITLPTVINGQTMPGGVDKYRFVATKGQRIVVATSARELIPYIADAVPGWFQAAVTLYDADGHEVNYADHFRFHPDPVLYYEIPTGGEYVLEIRDALYRGREDFVYRITLGELPFVTGMFPLGGKVGVATTVELAGWNLPAGKITLDAADKGAGVYPLSTLKAGLVSNAVAFAADSLPDAPDKQSNNSTQTAQAVTLPIIVNGRIDHAGQWRVFSFPGRAGQEIVAEVRARRLGSPLDSVLKLTDAKGKQLAFSDDCDDKGSGLETHHADSYLRTKLTDDGTYYLYLGDIQHQGGAEFAYRLRISEPQPDYELRVAPSSINVRGGGTVPITVYALRKDGFSGEIDLALKDAPAGFVLGGAVVPAGQDHVRITLTAPASAVTRPATTGPATQPAEVFKLHMEGQAQIQGRQVVKPAVPAEDMMQAFAYRHLVPAQDLYAAVSGRFASRVPIRIIDPLPVKIPAGKTASILVGTPQNTPFGNIQLELDDPPDGITLKGLSSAGRGTVIVLQCDAAKVKPGMKGNLIVNVLMAPRNPPTQPATQPATSPTTKPATKPTTSPATSSTTKPATAPTTSPAPPPVRSQANQRRAAIGTLPAIPFEIVEP